MWRTTTVSIALFPTYVVVIDYINEVGEEIYQGIRVAYPGFDRAKLPGFINPVEGVVADSVVEEDQRILDTYEPAPLQESDSDPDDVPSISDKTALQGLENLHLSRLENPHINPHKGGQVEALLYREKWDIEGLQGMAQRAQRQTTITGFVIPRLDIS